MEFNQTRPLLRAWPGHAHVLILAQSLPATAIFLPKLPLLGGNLFFVEKGQQNGGRFLVSRGWFLVWSSPGARVV